MNGHTATLGVCCGRLMDFLGLIVNFLELTGASAGRSLRTGAGRFAAGLNYEIFGTL